MSPTEKSAILVLGMHRSGTSAMTRTLSLLGADLPTQLLPPTARGNPTGFWESKEFCSLHDELLASAGSSWDDWLPLAGNWLGSPAADAFKQRALALLQQDFAGSPLFVVKDPRICRFLPFWLDVLREFGAQPYCVLMLRNPLEVAASLQQRDAFTLQKSLMLWLRHILDAEFASRGLPRALARYEDLLGDWRGLVDSLTDALGIRWPRRSTDTDTEVDAFLNQRHRHHSISPDMQDPAVSEWIRTASSGLEELGGSGEAAARARLDALRAETERAGEALGALLAEREASSFARLEASAARVGLEAADRAEVLERELAQARESVAELAADALRLGIEYDAQRDQQTRELTQARSSLADLERQTVRLESELLERERLLSEGVANQLALRRQSEALARRLEMRDGYVEELSATLESLQARVRKAEAAEADRAASIDQLQRTLEEHESQRRALELQSDRLTREVAQAQARLYSAEQQHDRQAQSAKAELTKAEQQISVSTLDAARARHQQRLLQTTLATTHLEISQTRAERRTLAARLNWVQTRLSWQAAKPLLWLEHRVPLLFEVMAGGTKALGWALTGQLSSRLRLWRQAGEIAESGLFDEAWYVGEHPDVLTSGYRPLHHWLLEGAARGWSPHPLFDPVWYLQHCREGPAPRLNPLLHYLRHGGDNDPHPLFDTGWYRTQYAEAESGEGPALVHYLRHGAALGLNPHPLFDTLWYLRRNPQVAAQGDNPLAHYVRQGADEGVDPNPLFHTDWYRRNNLELNASGANPLVHYLLRNDSEGGDPNPLFDTDWYLERYPEVASSGVNPLLHYRNDGSRVGYDPHPLFTTSWYLRGCPAAQRTTSDPLTHYLSQTGPDWCDPSPLFDTQWYFTVRPDAAREGGNPLLHYLGLGAAEGAEPNPVFNAAWYLESYPEVAEKGLNPLYHYRRWGVTKGYRPSPEFDPQWYRDNHPEIVRSGIGPLEHYLTFGRQLRFPSQRSEQRLNDEYPAAAMRIPGWSQNWSVVAPPASLDSGRVLIIDRCAPTPDRDSGSFRMSKIISGLIDAGVPLDFIGHQPAPEARYQVALEKLGLKPIQGPEAALAHLTKEGPHYRSVILSRPETVEAYLPLVRAFAVNAKVCYDTVDLHWVRFSRGAQLNGDPDMARLADHYRRLELANAQSVDLTLVVTEEERRILHEQSPELAVEILPNIHETVLNVPGFGQRSGLFFLGGFEHAPNLDAMNYFVTEVLPLITKRIPDIRLTIAGSSMPDAIRRLAGKNVDIPGYVPDVHPWLLRSRVFVAPLRYGAGMKGKVGQSMGVGLPVATTSVGAEGMHLEDHRHACIADDPKAFARAVVELYTDAALWSRISTAGRELISDRFSEDALRDRLLSIVGHDLPEEAPIV